MFRPSRRSGVALASTLLFLAAPLAACSTDTGAGGADPDEQAEQRLAQCGGYDVPDFPDLPVVEKPAGESEVETEFGTVALPDSPSAALGMYTTDVDILIWLGYPLADTQPIRGDAGYSTFPCFFPDQPLEGIATFANYPDFNYERVLLAEPDFILNGLGYDTKTVERLADIAPTYSVNAFDGQSWQIHFEQTARALGREDRYQLWEEVYQERLAEVKEQIGETEGIVVSPLGYWEGAYQTACGSSVECTVLADLGLELSASSLTNDGEGEALSAEQIGQLQDIDYVFMLRGLGEEGQESFDELLAEAAENPLWQSLEFVQSDQIVSYEMEMTFGSPSGQLAFLEVVAEAMGS